MTYGTITAASLQPATGPLSPKTPLGTTYGTVPSRCCASRTSCIHFMKNPRTSAKYAAVFAKICVSPVQPSRSVRCGQSVGMEM